MSTHTEYLVKVTNKSVWVRDFEGEYTNSSYVTHAVTLDEVALRCPIDILAIAQSVADYFGGEVWVKTETTSTSVAKYVPPEA